MPGRLAINLRFSVAENIPTSFLMANLDKHFAIGTHPDRVLLLDDKMLPSANHVRLVYAAGLFESDIRIIIHA